MDQHPIPQNVTGFQFKLIGSMTVKQFGYVASGVIMAAIIYYLPLKDALSILLKVIFIPFFGSIGAIVAFLPIDGRPIDVMISNFMQALFSPNQYVYRKTVNSFSFSNISLSRPQPVTQSGPKSHHTPKQNLVNERGLELQKLLVKNNVYKIKNDLDAREQAFLSTLYVAPAALESTPIAPSLSTTTTPINPIQAPIIAPTPLPIIPSQPIQPIQPMQKLSIPHVRSMPKEMNKNVGILVSDTPNVVTGIVKDARGNVLQNILVEIKDQKGNPVRAFKTNSLGNFASATPLPLGAYTIILEDPKRQHTFDTIQFTTQDQIMNPIEITSYDKREELRRELFN